MSKKNKDIEVRIEEELTKNNGQTVPMDKLFIGKKEIGRILTENEKKFSVVIDARNEVTVKTFEEAVEYIIRQWNLND